jgi:hypothetical protein
MPSDDTVGETHEDERQGEDKGACVEPVARANAEGSPQREPRTLSARRAAACAWRVSATKLRICSADGLRVQGRPSSHRIFRVACRKKNICRIFGRKSEF